MMLTRKASQEGKRQSMVSVPVETVVNAEKSLTSSNSNVQFGEMMLTMHHALDEALRP